MSETFGKLTPICPLNSPGVMTTLLNITPKVNLIQDLKFGKATMTILVSMSSTPPSPTPLNIRITSFTIAAGNRVHSSSVDFVASFATVSSEGFFGAGTINGLKRILINEAYGSVDIYSNGAGGFYTSGKDVNIKQAKALINMTLLSTAVGVGDVLKTRTATITLPLAMSGDMQHAIGKATIEITAAMISSNDLLISGKLFTPGITVPLFMSAEGHIANVALHLADPVHVIFDADPLQFRPQNTLRARVLFDATDGYVYQQKSTTGILTQVFPLTDWTNAKNETWHTSQNPSGLFENLKLRATLIGGTQPTFGQLFNVWLGFVKGSGNLPQVLEWQNELVNPFETGRFSTLFIELSEDDGTTILASGTYQLSIIWGG